MVKQRERRDFGGDLLDFNIFKQLIISYKLSPTRADLGERAIGLTNHRRVCRRTRRTTRRPKGGGGQGLIIFTRLGRENGSLWVWCWTDRLCGSCGLLATLLTDCCLRHTTDQILGLLSRPAGVIPVGEAGARRLVGEIAGGVYHQQHQQQRGGLLINP